MPVFDAPSIKQIKEWDRAIGQRIDLLLETAGLPEDDTFIRLANDMAAAASGLRIRVEERDKGLTRFGIAGNIRFSAFPLQKELAPFLDALEQAHTRPEPLSASLQKLVETVTIPVHLKLYIALQCPHCPNMVRTLIPLALHNPLIILDIIDGSLFPETARQDRIMAAPCLILDDDFRWTGYVAEAEILTMITQRDPENLSAASLKNILEQGDASWITNKMIERGTIFNAFVGLLLDDTWSVRLGAMVIVEELAATAPDLADQLCPLLISAFPDRDVPVQGDILYALGEAGSFATGEWIESQLPTLSHPDLKDAAMEALETIKERHG